MRTVILHAHLFKNAGTTLDSILKHNFGHNFCDHRDNQAMNSSPDYLENYLRDNSSIQALSSHHMPGPVPEITGINSINLIMLRHPLARVRSVYTFEKKQPDNISPGSRMASKLSFPEYIDWRLSPEGRGVLSNFHLQALSPAGAEMNEQSLEQAWEILTRRYQFGIVDDFDRSLQLMGLAINEVFPDFQISYIKQNVTNHSADSLEQKLHQLREQLGVSRYRQLEDANKLDLQLYRQACKLLNERYLSQGLTPENLQLTASPSWAKKLYRLLTNQAG